MSKESRKLTKISKFMSFILRHKPGAIGLVLDPQGWAQIDDLVAKSNAAGTNLSREELLLVVEKNDKKRFSLSDDGRMIRAAQGHSVSVDLGIDPLKPPDVLYHGTATRFLDSILSTGLQPQSRRQVHLSLNESTARKVGQRHGKPIILIIDALLMYQNGFKFFLTDNDVWLTDHVPPEFIIQPTD